MESSSQEVREYSFDPLRIAKLGYAVYPYLYNQADMNNIPIAKELLKCGVSPNVKVENGKVPLHIAAERGFIEMTKLLLENQAETEIKDSHNMTPLHYAAARGHQAVVDLLLRPKVEKGNLKKALILAYDEGQKPIVKKLIRRRADVNVTDEKGVSLLTKSVAKGDKNIVDIILKSKHKIDEDSLRRSFSTSLINENLDLAFKLLDHGVDINGCDHKGTTHLQLVVPLEKREVVEFLLLNNADPDLRKNNRHLTPLISAVHNRSYKIAKELLGFSADVNAKVENGLESLTALSCALDNKDNKMAKLLINYKADVNHMRRSGQTELGWAMRGDVEGVKLLLENDANPNKRKDRNCLTPLHVASARGEVSKVNLLLDANAKVDMTEKEGLTPLMMASRENNQEAARSLIEHKAKIDYRDKSGKTALYHAVEHHHFNMADMLLRRNASVEAPSTQSGKTLLYLAAKNEKKHVIKFFLDNGANLDAKDRHGRPLICRAARHRDYRTVATLYKLGADLSEKDSDGKTALNHAAGQGSLKIVEFLVQQNGCNPFEKDSDDLTASQQAKKKGHSNIYQTLRKFEKQSMKKRRRSISLSRGKHGSNRIREYHVGAGSFNGS